MIGFKEILVILVIVLLIFGTKKIRSLGGDLGSAIKNFKDSMKDGETEAKNEGVKPDAAIESKTDNKTDDRKA